MSPDEQSSHEYDLARRHYKPAGGTVVCGALKRVYERGRRGDVPSGAILKVPTTTDVRKVECGTCKEWILAVTINW